MSQLQPIDSSPRAHHPRPSAPIGVVFADTRESGSFQDRLTILSTVHGAGFTIHQGAVSERAVLVLLTGAEPDQTAAGVEALIAGHRPGWIISAGFAQALDDSWKHGELLLAEQIVSQAGHEISPTVPSELTAVRERLRLRSDRLLTVERPLGDPGERRAAGCEFQAAAADRQAFVVGTVCQREGFPFFAVRVIAEEVADRVPADVAHLTSRPTLARRLGALAGALVHRPGSIKDVWNYYEASVTASAALAKTLAELVVLLP